MHACTHANQARTYLGGDVAILKGQLLDGPVRHDVVIVNHAPWWDVQRLRIIHAVRKKKQKKSKKRAQTRTHTTTRDMITDHHIVCRSAISHTKYKYMWHITRHTPIHTHAHTHTPDNKQQRHCFQCGDCHSWPAQCRGQAAPHIAPPCRPRRGPPPPRPMSVPCIEYAWCSLL